MNERYCFASGFPSCSSAIGAAALSYVGLGIPDQLASCGTMLHDASSNVRVFADFPWLLSPAAAMFLVVLGLNLALE